MKYILPYFIVEKYFLSYSGKKKTISEPMKWGDIWLFLPLCGTGWVILTLWLDFLPRVQSSREYLYWIRGIYFKRLSLFLEGDRCSQDYIMQYIYIWILRSYFFKLLSWHGFYLAHSLWFWSIIKWVLSQSVPVSYHLIITAGVLADGLMSLLYGWLHIFYITLGPTRREVID